MRKIIGVFLLILLFTGTVSATTVTATVTDPNSVLYANATYAISFQPAPGAKASDYLLNGATFTGRDTPITGFLNSSGVLSVTLSDNTAISPSGSTWTFRITSANGTNSFTVGSVLISGSSVSLTTQLSAGASAILGGVAINSPTSGVGQSQQFIYKTSGQTAPAFVLKGTDGASLFQINADGTCTPSCTGGGTPGGTSSQVQFNNSGAFGGFTVSGDSTLNTATGVMTNTGMNGVQYSTLATGIVKNATTTGVPSIAIGTDLPAGIPIASVGSAGLSATAPANIAATGVISLTVSGTGSVCLTTSCVMTTPNIGTPASGNAANLTGLPVAGCTGCAPLASPTFTGTVTGPNYVTNGATAGFYQCTQGTANGHATANTFTIECPAAVTAYELLVPGAAASGIPTWTNASGVVTESITATNGTGNVVLTTSPTLVTPVLGAATGTSLSVSGSLTSTVATGTAPIVVTSTTTVPNLTVSNHPTVQFCGTTTTCSHTAESSPKIVFGSAALVSGTPSTATITGISPAFTATADYVCTVTGQSAATTSLYSVANVSASSFTITGPATTTTVINYVCVGF
jgi:hypothetical protein